MTTTVTGSVVNIKNTFGDYQQFIIHKGKIPADYRTGQTANPHDPAVWTDYQTAVAAATVWGDGYGLGFVFTEADPYFFLDIDKCYIKGYWSTTAVELCNLFHGCRVEVSQSGTGLHIFGRGVVPPHSCKNGELGLEFYNSGRYVALTDSNARGDENFDASHILPDFIAKYFPPEADNDAATWQEGHELGWELPDDAELIRRALRMNSANAVFGGRVSFRDLWEAKADVLAKQWPASSERTDDCLYDASSADMALASKLAWLTGNDCPRIERLMWQSALRRDKWEKHKNYLTGFTIPRALVRDGGFYDPKYKERRDQQRAELLRLDESGDIHELSEILTLEEMLDRFVMVNEGKRVADLKYPKRILSQDEWRNSLQASQTVIPIPDSYSRIDGSPKTKQVPTTKIWESRQHKEADTITFRPGFGVRTVDPDTKRATNTWRPFERREPAEGYDAGIFIKQVVYLFQDDADRFLDWLAHIEQKPGVLPHTGWVHISPMQGTGRNWLSSVLFKVWQGYVAPGFDLSGTLRSGYNGDLSCRLLAIVDEINEGGSGAKWENAEALKSIVTPAYRRINPKYGYQRLEYNCCRWLIFSNHTTALPLTEGDRRFNVVQNDLPPRPPSHYEELYSALDDPEFIAAVAWMLRNRDISGFQPGAHALLNEAKMELVAASQTEADELLADLVKNHPSDLILASKVTAMLTGQQFGGKQSGAHKHAMHRQGIKALKNAVRLSSGMARINILRNHSYWQKATVDQIRAEMERS